MASHTNDLSLNEFKVNQNDPKKPTNQDQTDTNNSQDKNHQPRKPLPEEEIGPGNQPAPEIEIPQEDVPEISPGQDEPAEINPGDVNDASDTDF